MKRKVVNPDIEEKKHQQAMHKVQERDLGEELKEERVAYPKKKPKVHPKSGHK
jgi:hypothetical protein